MEVESSLQDKVLFESVVYCLPGQGVVDNPAGICENVGVVNSWQRYVLVENSAVPWEAGKVVNSLRGRCLVANSAGPVGLLRRL